MELSINDEKTKEIITEIIVELLQTRKELFTEIIKESLEELALANAIIEGRKNDFVPEAEIFSILEETSL